MNHKTMFLGYMSTSKQKKASEWSVPKSSSLAVYQPRKHNGRAVAPGPTILVGDNIILKYYTHLTLFWVKCVHATMSYFVYGFLGCLPR